MADVSDYRIQFRNQRVAEAADARSRPGKRNLTAARDLERYYSLLAAELAGIELSEAEASLVCDALNGTLFEPHTIRLLWAEVDDAIRHDGLAEKWGVDGPALVERLRSLTPGQAYALVDAVERFWLDASSPASERLRTAGLVR